MAFLGTTTQIKKYNFLFIIYNIELKIQNGTLSNK